MESRNHTSQNTVRIGVLGASGYTGAEVLRLLANHPQFRVALLTADRKAGQPITSVFPHLGTQNFPDLIAIKDANFSDVDAVFCCLPHGTTQEIIKGLPKHLKIVDLSADFRLRDISEYEEWYGKPHRAPDLQKEAIYGLTEILREELKNARLVANPGCYPTSIQLPLVPLIKTRGMQATIYVEMVPGVRIEDLYQQLKHFYEDEEFVVLLENGAIPRTHSVRGTNYCLINVFPDRIPGRAIIIDNLVKGDSGQALQNLNAMLGFPENLGLHYQPLFH